MENTNCETCAGDGAVITYNTKDDRLEVQRCDECASFDTDQEAWEALKRGTGHRLSVRKPASHKLADLGSRHEEVFIKFGGPRRLRRGKDKGIGRMFHVERNLVW